MRPIEGRLQTAEHILVRILQDEIQDATIGISKFKESSGLLEITTRSDPRELSSATLQKKINQIIDKGLPVKISMKDREEAGKEVDLWKIPHSVRNVRIVEIQGFDKKPCIDPHVRNTREIGEFVIQGIKRVGKDRYRFTFHVR